MKKRIWSKGVKKIAIIASIGSIATILGGCAFDDPYTEISDEDYTKVVEYSAGLLLKYSNNMIDKMVYVSSDSASTAESSSIDDTGSTQNELDNSAAGLSNESINNFSNGNTMAPGNSSSSGMPDSIGDGPDALCDAFGGLDVKYNGFEVTDCYPSLSDQGAVIADNGDKILVLKFTLTNNTSTPVSIDMTKEKSIFLITVNNKKAGYTLVTMQPDDLSSYVYSFKGGESEDVVLLCQTGESELTDVASIKLSAEVGDFSKTVILE